MYISMYNLILDFDSDYSVVFNPLSGAIDLIGNDILEAVFNNKSADGIRKIDPKMINRLLKRRYLFSSKEEEQALLQKAYTYHQKLLASAPKRFLVIPTYFCNLKCTYCYQAKLDRKADLMTEEVLRGMLDAIVKIDTEQPSSSKPIVLLFGGEPLIRREKQPEIIELILAKCQEMGYLTKIITNGVDLEFFTDMLSAYSVVRHVHVTMDGPKSIHDKRRQYASKKGTFDRIVRGIDSAIEKGIDIEIHVNLDQESVKALPEFANFVLKKGWVASKQVHPHLSAVQGTCLGDGSCFTWSSMCTSVFYYYETRPETSVFSLDLPLVQLFDRTLKGESIMAQRFSYCGANTNMFIFDLYGDIYVCNGNVGMKDFTVGQFYPTFEMNHEKLSSWRNRNIFTIPECRTCKVNLLCGGGCGASALRKNGTLNAPSCEPIMDSLKCVCKHYASLLKEAFPASIRRR